MTEREHSFSEYLCLGKIRQQTTTPQVELGWKTGMSLFDDMVLLVARLQFSEVGFASSIQPACFASIFVPQMANAFWNELVDILSGGNPEMRVMTDSEGGARCHWEVYVTPYGTSTHDVSRCCTFADGTVTCTGWTPARQVHYEMGVQPGVDGVITRTTRSRR